MDNNSKNRFSENIFNKKLFVQAFLQLKIVGIVSVVCSSILTILVPVMYNIDHNNTEYGAYIHSKDFMDIPSYFFPLIMVIFILTPLMCLLIFNFLTKRNGSDFYHSAPVKRRCIYLTFISAVICWAAIIIIWYTLVLCTMFSFFADNLVMDIPNILMYDLNVLISCILVAAVTGLACSVTGTLFSNFAMSVTILFVPRILITTFCYNIFSDNPLINHNCLPELLKISCNMPASVLFAPAGLLYGHSYSDTVFMGFNFSTAYTFILAVIYIALGVYAFTKRPSETAGKSFSHKGLNFVFRLLVGYIISLIGITILYENYKNNVYYNIKVAYEIESVVTVFVFAVISMFVCEVINSRSLKKSLMAFATAPIVLVLDVITFFVLIFAGNVISDGRIDAKNTEYISFPNFYSYTYFSYSDEYYDMGSFSGTDLLNSGYTYGMDFNYYENAISGVEITDPDIIAYVSDIYNTWCDKNQSSDDRFDFYDTYTLEITYDDTFGNTSRLLNMTKRQYTELMKKLNESEVFSDVIKTTPDIDYATAVYCDGLTDTQAENLYETLRKDISKLSYSEWYDFLGRNSENIYDLNYLNAIIVEKYSNGKYICFTIPITSITPEAYKLYLKYYNSNNSEAVLKLFEQFSDDSGNINSDIHLRAVQITDDGVIGLQHTFSSSIMHYEYSNIKDLGSLYSIVTETLTSDSDDIFDDLISGQQYLFYLECNTFEDDTLITDWMHAGGCYFAVPYDSPIFEELSKYAR